MRYVCNDGAHRGGDGHLGGRGAVVYKDEAGREGRLRGRHHGFPARWCRRELEGQTPPYPAVVVAGSGRGAKLVKGSKDGDARSPPPAAEEGWP